MQKIRFNFEVKLLLMLCFFALASLLLFLDPADDKFLTLLSLRFERVLFVLLIGVGLSVSGLLMQTIFANQLAGPYTLGIGGAVAMGANVAFIFSASGFLLGLIFGLLFTFFLLKVSRYASEVAVLIFGLVSGFFFNAAIMLFNYFTSDQQILFNYRWFMGNFAYIESANLYILAVLTVVLFIVAYLYSPKFDMLLLGNDMATSAGLNVTLFKQIAIALTCLLIAVIVSTCGPIAFIGVIVPNLIKFRCFSEHRAMLLQSALGGATLLLICDFGARFANYPFEIPIGIITAVIGAPLFIYVLIKTTKLH